MSQQESSPPSGLVWGKILTWVGLLLVITGGVLAILFSFLGAEEGDIVESFAAGTICCFGPLALIGFITFIVGVVLWTTNRQ